VGAVMGSKKHILQSLQQKEINRPQEGFASMRQLSAALLGAASDREVSSAPALTGALPQKRDVRYSTLPQDPAAGRSSSRRLQLQTEEEK